ncbi:MAG TPA: hypothetical protein VFH38_00280 [Jatrophihabitans sp.]|nr:hypothetical protein [Jatrophihabitans sp.]
MTPSTDRRALGGRGIALVLLGTALVVASLVALTWYSVTAKADVAGNGFTFPDLRANADQLNAPVASAYFDWLAWALVIGAAVVGIVANIPTRAADVLRVLGFLAGVAGVIGTYYAMAQLFYAQHAAGGSTHGVWHNSNLGLWCALAGFALLAIGAVWGPGRA